MANTVPVLWALCTGARNTEKEIISGAFIYFELLLWPGNDVVFQNAKYRVKVLIASYIVTFGMGGKKNQKNRMGFFSAFQQIAEDFARLAW